jgi:hypothetical protein
MIVSREHPRSFLVSVVDRVEVLRRATAAMIADDARKLGRFADPIGQLRRERLSEV